MFNIKYILYITRNKIILLIWEDLNFRLKFRHFSLYYKRTDSSDVHLSKRLRCNIARTLQRRRWSPSAKVFHVESRGETHEIGRKDGAGPSRFTYCDQAGTWASAPLSFAVMRPAYAYTQWHLLRSRVWIIIRARNKSLREKPYPRRISSLIYLHPQCRPALPDEQCTRRLGEGGYGAQLVIIMLNYRYPHRWHATPCVHACVHACVDNLFHSVLVNE